MRTKHFWTSTALVVGATGAAAMVGAISAGAAQTGRSATTPSTQDKAFMASNAQSNLAEIALGQLGEQRAGDAATTKIAQVTLADHQRLQSQLASIAKAAGVTLPTTPSATQQQVAATLKATSASSFDLAYAQAEVQGHQLAIATAKTETTAGSDPSVTSYATGYIPVAAMHLDMATSEVSALSGASSPTSVSAGTGGRAQTDLASSPAWIGGTAAGLVLVAGSGAALVRRRRA